MHADREIKEERDHHRRSDNDRHQDREGTILTPKLKIKNNFVISKSFSEAFILASTNPQFDKRLFIDLSSSVSSEHVVFIDCSEYQNKNKKQFTYVHNMF